MSSANVQVSLERAKINRARAEGDHERVLSHISDLVLKVQIAVDQLYLQRQQRINSLLNDISKLSQSISIEQGKLQASSEAFSNCFTVYEVKIMNLADDFAADLLNIREVVENAILEEESRLVGVSGGLVEQITNSYEIIDLKLYEERVSAFEMQVSTVMTGLRKEAEKRLDEMTERVENEINQFKEMIDFYRSEIQAFSSSFGAAVDSERADADLSRSRIIGTIENIIGVNDDSLVITN